MLRTLLLAALLLPAALSAQPPRSYLATVTHVTDGDTVWVRPARGGRPVQVRLLDVDAPELCQPFGAQARHALERRLLHQPVTVQPRGRDDYRRVLARLQWEGQDVGGWLVASGLAWSPRYRQRPGRYDPLQSQARQARLGLWAQPQPMAPRTFRQWHGPCAQPPAHRPRSARQR